MFNFAFENYSKLSSDLSKDIVHTPHPPTFFDAVVTAFCFETFPSDTILIPNFQLSLLFEQL